MSGFLRTLLLLYKRNLRVQPLRELMAICGIAAGVALLFAVQVAHRSITGSLEQITNGVAGKATLELAARGPNGFSEQTAEEAERTVGVRRAAPVLEEPILATGKRGRRALMLIGATEQISSLRGPISHAFEHAANGRPLGLLLLSEQTAQAIGARTGDTVTIAVAGQTRHMSVAGMIPSSRLGAAANAPIAATTLPVAQILAGQQGRISRLLIEPRSGKEQSVLERLRRRFGPSLDAREVSTEARLLGDAAGPEKQVTLLFSVISIVAGIVLAYNALLLASEERRRFMVHLIRTGTRESLIVASLTFDALVLGILGSVLGLAAGDGLSLLAYQSVPGYIAAAFPIGGGRVVDTNTILIALISGVLAAFAAAALPALRILRASAEEEPEAVGRALAFTHRAKPADRVVFAAGSMMVLISIATSALAPITTVFALAGLAGGLVLCVPMTTRYLLKLVRALAQGSSDPARLLSVAELRSASTRTIALFATGTIAAFLMVLIGGSVADVKSAASRGAGDLLSSAPVWVKPGGVENVYTTQPFASAVVKHRLEDSGVVSTALAWQDSFLDLPNRRVWVLGVPNQTAAQIAPSQLVDGSLQTADARLREGGWAALSAPIAREWHLRIGQPFTLPTPSGNAKLRLAATIGNYGWLPGAIVIDGVEHERLWASRQATQLAVTFRSGITPAQGRASVEGSLPARTALAVKTSGERRAEVGQVLGSTLSRLNETTLIVLVVTITSVLALMLSAVAQRRGRLSSLISMGMDFRQLSRLVFYETGTPLILGCLTGTLIGLLGQALIDSWLSHTTGASLRYSPAWQLGLRTLVIATAISLLASFAASSKTVRLKPQAAFSTE